MLKITNAAFAAIALACLSSAAPALADDHVQMQVSTRGLQLDSAAGLAALGRRVHIAAMVACDNGGADLASRIVARECRADLERVGAAQIAELAARRNVMLATIASAR
jgi:UrcA family protein